MKNIFKNLIVKILSWEAKLLLHNQSPKIIAITGSVGKTSTKDAIYSLISDKFHARKSEKSFNSELGVPLTILGLKNAWSNPFFWIINIVVGFFRIFFSRNYPRVLVLEVGADKPNDIKNIVSWVKPDVSIVTALAPVPVHVENFGSPEMVYEEKGRLVEALGADGIAVLNSDDERILLMKRKTMARTIMFGMSGPTDVIGSHPSFTYDKNGNPRGITFRIDYEGKSIPFEINGALGFSHVYSCLGAAAVAISLGMNVLEIAEAAKKISTPLGRMKIIEGIKNSTIIDDTYNSSPVALESALNTIGEVIAKGRKVAVLGDMLELGDYSEDEHKRIGKIASNKVNILVTVGMKARGFAEGALNNGMDEKNILQFETSREAGNYVQNLIKNDDLILVKGSQGIRMERFVEEVILHPEEKNKLLVRQDEEWARR